MTARGERRPLQRTEAAAELAFDAQDLVDDRGASGLGDRAGFLLGQALRGGDKSGAVVTG